LGDRWKGEGGADSPSKEAVPPSALRSFRSIKI
jgi:hypothetical protein